MTAGTVRRYWLAGRCCCCGQPLDYEGLNGEQHTPIGEGVEICGWCVYRGHDKGDVVPVLLEAVVTGIDP